MVTLVDLYTKQELLDRIREKSPGMLINHNISVNELKRIYAELLETKSVFQDEAEQKAKQFQLNIDWKDVNYVRVFHMVEKCHAIFRDVIQEVSNEQWKAFQENDFRFFAENITENHFVKFQEHDMILSVLSIKIELIESIKSNKSFTRNEFYLYLESCRKDLLQYVMHDLYKHETKDNIQHMMKKAVLQSCLSLISFYTILVESFDGDYKNETENMITKVKEGISL